MEASRKNGERARKPVRGTKKKPQNSLAAAKVSKARVVKSRGKAERKIAAKPKAKAVAKPKAKAAAARKTADAKAKKKFTTLSKSAKRAVSTNSKEKRAQKMSQYRRRLTMEKRILEYWDKVGGSALLVDVTSGGAARPGRTHMVGSGCFGPEFNDLTLHDVLKPIIDEKADWRKATKEMTMQGFFRKVSLEDYGVVVPPRSAAADADMVESSGSVSE